MHHLCDVFEVLFNPEVDVGCSVEKLTLAYPNDFLKCDLETEFLRYREIFAHFESKIIGDVPKMLNEIYRCELQNCIPQVCIALRICDGLFRWKVFFKISFNPKQATVHHGPRKTKQPHNFEYWKQSGQKGRLSWCFKKFCLEKSEEGFSSLIFQVWPWP